MPLVPCPDCQKDISDQATNCLYCGFPLAQHTQKLKDENLARLEQAQRDQAQREKDRYVTLLIGAGVVIFIVLMIAISNSNSAPTVGASVFEIQNQATNMALEDTNDSFKANGTIKIQVSCTGKSKASVEFKIFLQENTTTPIWSKTLDCPSSGTGTIQVSQDLVQVTATITGSTQWSIKAIQQ